MMEMRWQQLRVAPKFNDWCPYRTGRDTQRHEREKVPQ